MTPTLKSTHDANRSKILEIARRDPTLLYEALDDKRIDEITRALAKLKGLLSGPDFKSLTSFQLGLQKAHQELRTVLDYGAIRSWAHSIMPKGVTALSKLNAFLAGLIRLLRQLPKIVDIARGGMNPIARSNVAGDEIPASQEQWDPKKPLKDVLDDETLDSLRRLIKRAMTPKATGFLKLISYDYSGLPYIDNDEAVEELLSLTFEQINNLNSSAQKTPEVNQSPIVDEPVEASTGTKPPPPEAGQEPEKKSIIPPKPAETQGATPKAGASIQPVLPLVAANRISKLFIQSHMEIYGKTHQRTKKDSDFKVDLTQKIIEWLASQGYVKMPKRHEEEP